MIMSQHQFYEPDNSVVERQGDGTLTPFPNKELNDRQSHSGLTLDSVLGIRTDDKGVVGCSTMGCAAASRRNL